MRPHDHAYEAFLDRAMVGRIATVSRTGRPHVNPLYFYVADGNIHLGTAVYTLAAHNVRANPGVQILFDDERSGVAERLLRVDGTATVRTEPLVLKNYLHAITRKYILTPAGIWNMLRHPRQWIPMRRHVLGGGACVIEVEPELAEMISRPVELRARPSIRAAGKTG